MAKSTRTVSEQINKPHSQRPKKDHNYSQNLQPDISPAQSLRRASANSGNTQHVDILKLQRTLGNRAVGTLLGRTTQRPVIQAKLIINTPSDKYEQEADRVAEQIMRLTTAQPGLVDEDAEIPEILTKPLTVDESRSSVETNPEFEQLLNASRGRGEPLPLALCQEFEEKFGVDFSGVRIHANTEADDLNRAISALAFTAGQDVFFRQGAYKPESRSGRELIAHELTHVVQQGGADTQQAMIQRFYLNEQQPLPAENKQLQAKIQAYKNSRSLMAGFNQLTDLQVYLQKLTQAERQELAELEAEVKKERNLLGQLSLIGSNIQYCLLGPKKDSYRKLSGISDLSAHIPVEDIQGSYALKLVLDLHKLLPRLVNSLYQLAFLEGKTEPWALSAQASIMAKIQKDVLPAFADIQLPISLPETNPFEKLEKTEPTKEVAVAEPGNDIKNQKTQDSDAVLSADELSDEEVYDDKLLKQSPDISGASGYTADTTGRLFKSSGESIPIVMPVAVNDEVPKDDELAEEELEDNKIKRYPVRPIDPYGQGHAIGAGFNLIPAIGFNPSIPYAIDAAALFQKGGDYQHGIFWERKAIEIAPGSFRATIAGDHLFSSGITAQAKHQASEILPGHTGLRQAYGAAKEEDFSDDLAAEHEDLLTKEDTKKIADQDNAHKASLGIKPNQTVSDKQGKSSKSSDIGKPSTHSPVFGFDFYAGSEQGNKAEIEKKQATGLQKNTSAQTTSLPATKSSPVVPTQPNNAKTLPASPQAAVATPPTRVLPPGSVTGHHGLTVSPAMITAIRQDIMTRGIDSKWADQHEIGVLAAVLGVKIIVHYPSASSENGTGNNIYELYYNGRDHYDANIPDPSSELGYRRVKIPGDGDCFYNGIVTIARESKEMTYSIIGLRRIVHDNLTDQDIADIALTLIEDFKGNRLDGIGGRFRTLMRNRQRGGVLHYSDT